MTRTALLMLAAAAALAGCKAQTIDPNKTSDDTTANTAANGPVALPPSISSSKVYRCADNNVVHVDWMSDGKTANIRSEKGGTPTQVATAEAGKPMIGAPGYSLEGTEKAASAKIAVPGHPAQSCEA
jgi:hypothetical protein